MVEDAVLNLKRVSLLPPVHHLPARSTLKTRQISTPSPPPVALSPCLPRQVWRRDVRQHPSFTRAVFLDDLVMEVDLVSQYAAASGASPRNKQRSVFEINLVGEGVRAISVLPNEDVATIVGRDEPAPDKKRNRQRLSNYTKVVAAYVVLEDLRVLKRLIQVPLLGP